MPEYEIESCYRVVDVYNGVSLMIQSDPDGMDTIHISPSGHEAETHYGKWEFWLSIEQAKKLRDALDRKIVDMELEA